MRPGAGFSLIESALVLSLLGLLAVAGAVSFRAVRDSASGAFSAPLLATVAADAARALSGGVDPSLLLDDLLSKGLPVVSSATDPAAGEVSVALDDPASPSLLLVSAPSSGPGCLVALSRTLTPSAQLEWFEGASPSGCAAAPLLGSGLALATGGSRSSPAALP